MNGSGKITRRGFAGGALALLGGKAFGQGFAGLGETADGFAIVTPGKRFAFRPITARTRNSASSGGM